MFCTYKHIPYTVGTLLKNIFIFMLFIVTPAGIAKSNPTAPNLRQLAFKRAKSLDNGISVSWYEQSWNKEM